ncbi:hypothetical protein NLJ89_g10480 [Agrocybe chaxingu]|uniref:Arrestin C-terminal-like domain-containing protein n=1 Tax=Agrocybe chaxingu TaxID=84603 RepID=A0A9W8MQ89_9AGAR|nr:hypothetical protein NLJ89_g10480 [Agrocybe chaxingu]
MSQVRLNLQPPPNVDFVTGYPGIPPGPERPQAAVKGAIEVRVPPQGVKAKWVRIELRKVETLPGGGPANIFHDFVGPSPVNLWSSSDEYNLLRSQDFPFSIRIPESIPPTIQLDSRAGISYELVATVCTKGKRGFLRKAKSVVTTVSAPIIIDKHELHSTWPVYCQPDLRQLAQDGVSLIVERHRTCFGPGDRVSIVATVKSDSLNTVILRGFEIYIKEATVFRPGIHGAGKKHAPQVKQENIAETKYPINATLYGGTQHTAELSCMISPQHTTTTLNAARHIDVTYTLCVKALMGTGTHLVLDLPIIMSNWQREVSFEAISRIGAAPSLSLFPPAQSAAATMHAIQAGRIDPTRGRPADAVAATLPLNRGNLDNTYAHARNNSANAFNSLPGAPSSAARGVSEDPYGPGYGRAGNLADEFGATTVAVASSSSTVPARNRPGSAGGGNRLTIVNPEPSQEIPSRQRTAGSSTTTGSARQWPTAEEEKLKLYEQARAQVAKVQGVAASPPPASASSPPPQSTGTPSPARNANAGSSQQNQWMTAEEEKLRLFQQAQAAVHRTQAAPANQYPLMAGTPPIPTRLAAPRNPLALPSTHKQ